VKFGARAPPKLGKIRKIGVIWKKKRRKNRKNVEGPPQNPMNPTPKYKNPGAGPANNRKIETQKISLSLNILNPKG
jgi:hypothetical protein